MIEARQFRIAVTDLAYFCCREGDIAARTQRSPTAQQGQAGHQRLQGERPPHYQAEVAVKKIISGRYCSWVLAGRIDGLMMESQPLLEEIKTTYYTSDDLPAEQYRFHLAQAKLYAAILCQQQDLAHITIHLTYLKLDDNSVFQRHERFTATELEAFLEQCCEQYTQWLDQHCQFLDLRDQSLNGLSFPFTDYRAGQRTLSITLYRNIRAGQQGLYHAPTGLGKTMATLFPALRQLGEGTIKQIWYVTAKNSGHNSVKQALEQFTSTPHLRVLFLQSKDKLCANCPLHSQQTCEAQAGYYQRLPSARWEFQLQPHFNADQLAALAHRHNLCPHQLSRDLLPWVDLVVADYNYVFDPYTRLSEALSQSKQYCLLVDEAHNLPDRARGMFSARLYISRLKALTDHITDQALKRTTRKLARQCQELTRQASTEQDNPLTQLNPRLGQDLLSLSDQIIEWFMQQSWLLFPVELFENIMDLARFAQRAQAIEPEDVILLGSQPEHLHIYCTDPAPALQKISTTFHSVHYFSGSLLPLNYFQRCISIQPLESQLALDSPFPPEHQCTLVVPVNTRYQFRPRSLPVITDTITTLWTRKPGRYLLAVSSFEYLGEAMKALQAIPDLPLLIQPQSQQPEDRNAFLQALQSNRFVAGVIAGGLFAEGIDLENHKLDGVIIVGTCLPPPSQEREQIKNQFDTATRQGFDFAYRYPGVNRVIQTAGRLIRNEQDRGVVLLLDDRFSQSQYRALLPRHWNLKLMKNSADLESALDAFYQN